MICPDASVVSKPEDLPISLTAIVLAGGKSRRMGQDKALLTIAGMPSLRRVCDVALACTPQVKIVTPVPHRYRAIVPPACQFIVEQHLTTFGTAPDSPATAPTPEPTLTWDNWQPHGPLVGFAQGFRQVTTDWVLLLACDLPCLQHKPLQAWCAHLPQVPTTAIAALVTMTATTVKDQPGWEPLCGFYRREALDCLQTFIQAGGRSFQGWLATQTVYPLPPGNPDMLLNCNTLADIDQADQQLALEPQPGRDQAPDHTLDYWSDG